MKQLIIIGARGFGREIYNLALQCKGYKNNFEIKGFIDDNKDALRKFDNYPPIIDSVENYKPSREDVFICAIGDVLYKKKYINLILNKGGKFISLIHPSAVIDQNAQIGDGCIILQNATVGSGAIVGNFVLIQISTIIAHDVSIGNFSRIDCQVVCTGGSIINEDVTIHTSAVINQNITIEKGACVGSGSFVIRRVKEFTTVYGNPAIKLK